MEMVSHETSTPGMMAHDDPAEGVSSVDVHSLQPGTALTLNTTNSRYRLIILDGQSGKALMQGGKLFPSQTEIAIEGSMDDSGFRSGWIGLGHRLEFTLRDAPGATSRVRSITVEPL